MNDTIVNTADEMSKVNFINFYARAYAFSTEQLSELANMSIEDLRAMFIEGESY